jgi:putative hydrolase of the HAD superfamily
MHAALLLDLDDTLLNDRAAMAQGVLKLRTRHGLASQEEDNEIARRWDEEGRRLWREMAAGRLSLEAQRRARLRAVFSLEFPDHEADALFAEYLGYYEECWSLLPGAAEFLERTAHQRRALVTNGRLALVKAKLRKCGIAGAFHAVVTPDVCGASKPDPKVFQYALDALGVSACNAIMIGDNFEVDIAPARALGMNTLHIQYTDGPTPLDAYSAA